MENSQKSDSDEGARSTEAYTQSIRLLNEKRKIQARLREVDRNLRELETLANGVTRLAREDLDHKGKGSHAC